MIKVAPLDSPPVYTQFREILDVAIEKQNLKDVRTISDECTNWARDMSLENIDKLNEILLEKFGKDLNFEKNRKKIQAIVRRGAIKNLLEYEMLKDYFERNYQDDSKKVEMDLVNGFITEFEMKVRGI